MTDAILRLVPNVPVFRDALRCIKLWAKSTATLLEHVDLLLTPAFVRARHLLECHGISGWCRMGDAGCPDMSTLSESVRRRYHQQVLHHHASMVYSLRNP